MLEKHPTPLNLDVSAVAKVIDAAFECAQICTSCADACLSEDMVAELRYCIRQNLDCADVCGTTARLLSRQTESELTLFWGSLAATIVAGGVGLYITKQIVSPVRRLQKASRQIAGGRYDVGETVSVPGEIGDLSRKSRGLTKATTVKRVPSRPRGNATLGARSPLGSSPGSSEANQVRLRRSQTVLTGWLPRLAQG